MESQAVMQMNTMTIHHLSRANYEHVFNIIMSYEEKSNQGVWYIRLLMLYCMLKKGYLIPNRKPVYAICLKYLTAVKETDAHAMIEAQSKSLTQMLDVEESMLTTCVQFAATLFYTSSLEFSLIYGLPLLTEIFTLSVNILCELIHSSRHMFFISQNYSGEENGLIIHAFLFHI
jgi:hypothetical protein